VAHGDRALLETVAFRPGRLICTVSAVFRPLVAWFPETQITQMWTDSTDGSSKPRLLLLLAPPWDPRGLDGCRDRLL
jgi:hypothetical protein